LLPHDRRSRVLLRSRFNPHERLADECKPTRSEGQTRGEPFRFRFSRNRGGSSRDNSCPARMLFPARVPLDGIALPIRHCRYVQLFSLVTYMRFSRAPKQRPLSPLAIPFWTRSGRTFREPNEIRAFRSSSRTRERERERVSLTLRDSILLHSSQRYPKLFAKIAGRCSSGKEEEGLNIHRIYILNIQNNMCRADKNNAPKYRSEIPLAKY